MPTATDAELTALLAEGELHVLGRIAESSNNALLVQVGAAPEGEEAPFAVYKPVALERPLWDFPDGSHAGREHAAWLVDRWGGFDLIPPTVFRDGPHGAGSVQSWVGDPREPVLSLVDIVPAGACPDGWLSALAGEDADGRAVEVVHADRPELRTMAVLDAVLNNSDRKGGHVLLDGERVRGIDHGVSLGVEPKLRTVLWAWAGQPVPAADLARVRAVLAALASGGRDTISRQLTDDEIEALVERCERLVVDGIHPRPHGGWPAIPWPAL